MKVLSPLRSAVALSGIAMLVASGAAYSGTTASVANAVTVQ